MKAIIIAAGMGKRLKPFTDELPKCMLKIGDQSILERQLECYKSCGIEEIAIVKGYQKDKISFPDVTYYINDDYPNNNILRSLFYAEAAIDGEVVISYSDILFKQHVIEQLLTSREHIALVVDADWRIKYLKVC